MTANLLDLATVNLYERKYVHSVQQSMQFMIDLLPFIHTLNKDLSWGTELEVLDIGTATGAGANLLAMFNCADFFGTPMKVDAMDVLDRFSEHAKVNFPLINYIVADIFEYNYHRKWDCIICSHCIEHFQDPTDFINELVRRAKLWVLFYAPYMEQDLSFAGHQISITDELVYKFDPYCCEKIISRGWKNYNDEESKCIVFALKGQAQ